MAGLVPAIHVFIICYAAKTWMPATSGHDSGDAAHFNVMPGLVRGIHAFL